MNSRVFSKRNSQNCGRKNVSKSRDQIYISALVSFTLAGIMSIISIVAGSPVIIKMIFFTLTVLSLFIIVLLLASIL